MKISELDYKLPKKLIAQKPVIPRDHSRLMVIDRKRNKISNYHFFDLPKLLTGNDVLVFNESKVFPARVFATKETGGKIELLFLGITAKNTWEAIYKGKVNFGQTLELGKIKGTITDKKENVIKIKLSAHEKDIFGYLSKYGFTPLPPYIKLKDTESNLRKSYQTIYAKTVGSAAAPTAGLHFTKRLIATLKRKGIASEYLTLHVGPGTFAPIKENVLEKHRIHSESFYIGHGAVARLKKAKKEGKRIIAVGTTTARVLETLARGKNQGKTNLFIYPPFKFKFVDALITNFHLPKSTLLALVWAFAGKKLMKKAYGQALKEKYRFYSFGDASLII